MHYVHVSYVQVGYMYIEDIGLTCTLCTSYVQLNVLSVPACSDFVRLMYILHYTLIDVLTCLKVKKPNWKHLIMCLPFGEFNKTT